MRHDVRIDIPLLVSVLVLIGLGVVMVYSSSWALAAENHDDALFFLRRQAIFAGTAVVALVVGAAVDPQLYRKWAYPLLGAALVLLFLVLIPGVGPRIGIARRWIAFGAFHIQAGEVAKFALINYLAMSVSKKGPRMSDPAVGVVPHAIIAGTVIGLLLLEPDFGTAAMLTSVTLLMLFVGGVKPRYIGLALAAAVPAGILLVASSPYRLRRVLAFLDPWAHRYDIGYQVTESLMTLGSGGFWGLGLGAGRQKLFFLPAAHTDFIFSVLGEEMGFLGVLFVVCAFAVITVRGVQVALSHRSAFAALLALGLTSSLALQATFNISVALGLVPTKGLTLPFVSYGGSSLIVSAFMAGVLLRLSGEVAPAAEPELEEPTS